MGTTCLRDICGSKGNDWEEMMDQRLEEEAREMKRRKELGLPQKQVEQTVIIPPMEGKNNGKRDLSRERIFHE